MIIGTDYTIRDRATMEVFYSTGIRLEELLRVNNGKGVKKVKKVSPHTFRHTCATLMLRNKANIRHIQELLGHASLNTTQVYTSVAITDLKAAPAVALVPAKGNS